MNRASTGAETQTLQRMWKAAHGTYIHAVQIRTIPAKFALTRQHLGHQEKTVDTDSNQSSRSAGCQSCSHKPDDVVDLHTPIIELGLRCRAREVTFFEARHSAIRCLMLVERGRGGQAIAEALEAFLHLCCQRILEEKEREVFHG
ncbi:hypothetical protein ACLOJK_009808 [Asimina triloba]